MSSTTKIANGDDDGDNDADVGDEGAILPLDGWRRDDDEDDDDDDDAADERVPLLRGEIIDVDDVDVGPVAGERVGVGGDGDTGGRDEIAVVAVVAAASRCSDVRDEGEMVSIVPTLSRLSPVDVRECLGEIVVVFVFIFGIVISDACTLDSLMIFNGTLLSSSLLVTVNANDDVDCSGDGDTDFESKIDEDEEDDDDDDCFASSFDSFFCLTSSLADFKNSSSLRLLIDF